MPGPDRAVDRGLRLADHGVCVPWDAMAAIERAQADAEARHLLTGAGIDRGGVRERIRRLPAIRHLLGGRRRG
ncbi:MAG: hypothetical protein ACLGIJ_11605 [Candidatus Limnocylindria bacterium]